MKKFKSLFAILMVATMVLCLCACGDSEEPSTTGSDQSNTGDTVATEPKAPETEAPQQTDEPEQTDAPEVDYVYTVKVVDVDGNPMSGVFVQVCAGTTCVPVMTGEDGIAGYPTEVTGDGELAAKIIVIPEGYACVDGITEISMADGNTDVVFTLEPVA